MYCMYFWIRSDIDPAEHKDILTTMYTDIHGILESLEQKT